MELVGALFEQIHGADELGFERREALSLISPSVEQAVPFSAH